MKFSFNVSKAIVALPLTWLVTVSANSKYSYRISGLGGYAYQYSGTCGLWPFGNYVDVQASESTIKTTGNGGGTESSPSMWATFTLWSGCSESSASLIEVDWSWYGSFPDALDLSFPSNKLTSGYAKGTFRGLKTDCTIMTYSDEYGEWSWYDCDYGTAESVSVDVEVTWTGQGQSTQDRYSSTYRYPGGFYRYNSKGTTREAATAIVVTVDGSVVDTDGIFGGESYTYGSLTKTTSGSMDIYKN